jgi:TatD DNase family protein
VIDTHAHLDACAEPPAALLARARGAGVHRVVAIGSGIDSCRAALAVAEREDDVFCALGVHPHAAGGADATRLGELRELLRHDRAVAVGETGLDFYRDYAPRPWQRRLFERELELAAELGKPVVVHTRSADDETARTLAGFAGTVVLHCFSSPPLLDVALERGYYVSFAGNVTYPRANDLRAAAAGVPTDRILAETDSPYLAPQSRRGRPNEPANVVHVVEALAESRGENPDELARSIDANAATAFSLPATADRR